ncbi:MAG: PD-(D/E)XK nuclease family protein [Desulfobacterales bacterium]
MTFKIPEISRHECFERLGRDAVLATATRSLSRRMGLRYAEYRIEKGDEAWQTPDILPFNAWLSRLFSDFICSPQMMQKLNASIPHLMDEMEEVFVWESIIGKSNEAAGLLGISETARMVRESWSLCRQWKTGIRDGIEWSAPDPAAFGRWAELYEKFCQAHGYMDSASLPMFLADIVGRGFACQPGELILAGFDEYSPSMQELFLALKKGGTGVFAMARPKRKASARMVCLEDDASEIRAAALWARQRIEADPSARIGVVSPGLAQDRETVRRVFTDVFYPSALFSGNDPENCIFQISAAPALLQYPVVAAAKAILELACRQGAEVLEWSRILRQPFMGGAEAEYATRAALDAEIRSRGDLYLTVSRIAAIAGERPSSIRSDFDLKILSDILEKLRSRAGAMKSRQEPDKWMEEFSAVLEDTGWPGDQSLSSAEYQTVSAWQTVLESFSGISLLTGPMSFSGALDLLVRRLSETRFQPEQPDAGLRIAGVLEVAGEEFDSLWIMGLHHEKWPPPARPNPFIPLPIQRRLGLPHCSPIRELSRAGAITERLLESADEIVCSFSRTDGESTRLASPLIDHLKQIDADEVLPPNYDTYWQNLACTCKTEELSDPEGAPVDEGAQVAGGTGIFRSQALCPFQAYCRYRLGACGLEAPEPGLKPWQRGVLVHRALEFFWRRLGRSLALEEMAQAQLEDCIRQAVDEAVSKMAGKMTQTFTERFMRVETQRLYSLIKEWIAAETGRAPFEVEGTESRMNINIGGIGLLASADRIDRLDNGRLVIIDYKTGDISPGDWFAARLAEPQLPLYSLALGKDCIAGVFFARVQKNKAGYAGIAEADGIIPGCRAIMDDGKLAKDFESMQEVLDFWEARLLSLAEEIRTGYAAVMPVSENKACRNCDLSQICRIWESSNHDRTHKRAENE